MNLYFEEAGTHRREEALASLEQYFDGTEMFDSLEEALECSKDLMDTEYYSMRLVSDAAPGNKKCTVKRRRQPFRQRRQTDQSGKSGL